MTNIRYEDVAHTSIRPSSSIIVIVLVVIPLGSRPIAQGARAKGRSPLLGSTLCNDRHDRDRHFKMPAAVQNM